MINEIEPSLCRICLQSGATRLIFREVKEENSIYFKLRECFKEKIEDIKGYPQVICEPCSNTVDIVYNFINKFKQTQKLLRDRLVELKKEDSNREADSDTEIEQLHEIEIPLQEIEIPLQDIKTEPSTFLETLEDTDQFIEYFQSSGNESLEEKPGKKLKLSIKKEKVTKKPSYEKNANRTNRVAASILEGEFLWSGENWCLKSTQLEVPKIKQEDKPKRRNLRLKLPKKTKIKLPKLCDLCGDTFKNQDRLTKHRKKYHFSKPTKCKQCPRVCSSESNLIRHMKRKHGKRDFVCSICGSNFAYKGELTGHISKVHKDKPKKIFECKHCGKTYNSQKSVVIHERSAHTGERPEQCTICNKAFFHIEYLKQHMRLHTGEAPYKCPVCSRAYAQLGNMKSHLRIHRITDIDAATLSKMKPNLLKLLKI